jgi:hypothetical protein
MMIIIVSNSNFRCVNCHREAGNYVPRVRIQQQQKENIILNYRYPLIHNVSGRFSLKPVTRMKEVIQLIRVFLIEDTNR